MLFNSLTFLIFFPLTTAIYFLLPHRFRWAFLLFCSCLFYAAWVPAYLLILIFVVAIDYFAGLLIDGARGGWRKSFLLGSLVANIGVLSVFKYFDFINDNLHSLAQMIHWNYPVRNLGWILPIGLSFHTFQSMSYTIEVYLGRQRAERHPGIYALYVMFYPQLVAGPIERPQNLLHQFREHHLFDADRVFDGLRLMLWGFFKKVVIADRMAAIADTVYNDPHPWGGAYLWLATFAFAFQIYCDFSGYTDIARGCARVLGYELMVNFDRPYAARSVAEFWRRWHISLSSWFRDYLYIPLGGNRVALPRWCVNVMIVFVVSGLWHGASWTFAIWGALHGMYLIFSRLTAGVRAKVARLAGIDRVPPIFAAWKILVTFVLVAFAWIFFRARDLEQAGWIVRHLFSGSFWASPPFVQFILPRGELGMGVLLIAVLEIVQWIGAHPDRATGFNRRPSWIRWPAYYALIVAILWIGNLGGKSFIYFQF